MAPHCRRRQHPGRGIRRWGKFDASTGGAALVRAVARIDLRSHRCSVIRVMALSSGDVLQIGYKIQTGGLNPPMVALLHTDGSGAYDLWFPEADSPLRVSMLDVAQDAQDQVWLRVRESLSGAACSLRSLSRLDLATGEFKGRQVFGCLSNNPFASNELPSAWIDGPRDERLLTTLYSRQPPLPQTFGTALVDTTISAQGNLSVVASILPWTGHARRIDSVRGHRTLQRHCAARPRPHGDRPALGQCDQCTVSPDDRRHIMRPGYARWRSSRRGRHAGWRRDHHQGTCACPRQRHGKYGIGRRSSTVQPDCWSRI